MRIVLTDRLDAALVKRLAADDFKDFSKLSEGRGLVWIRCYVIVRRNAQFGQFQALAYEVEASGLHHGLARLKEVAWGFRCGKCNFGCLFV